MSEDPPIFRAAFRALHPPSPGGRHRWRNAQSAPPLPTPATEEFPAVTQPEHVKTSHPERKIGRLPKHTDTATHPRLLFGDFLRTGYTGTVPNTVDYSTQVTDWGMAKNDALGDCTAADAAHAERLWSKIGQGAEVQVSDADVVAFYSGSTGYNPQDPSTDQGGNMQDVCTYYRKTGIGPAPNHKIAAFFEVDPSNADQLRAALYLFGCVSIGMDFPAFAMDQFNQGKPWDVSRTNTNLEGGHDVLLVGMTKGGNYKVVTWGAVQQVTPAFWAKYMAGRDGEAWARVSQEWVRNGTAAGNALTVDALNAAFQQLTGQPGPFTGGSSPAPAPTPTPTPAPSGELPGCTALMRSISDQIAKFLNGGK